MNDTKIDVFGGTGFIGSKFCELYKNNAYVHPRDHKYPKFKNILYFISTTNNYNIFEDAHKDINTNLNVLMDVLENCKHEDVVFNYISSWFVYGECPLPAKEEYCCNPKGFYSITKKCAEDLLISYCNTFNIKYKIFRLCNVYGPGDKGVSTKKNALQYLINEIKNNKDIKLYHDGTFTRDYMYVDDVCKAIMLCIENAPLNSITNIGSGIPYYFRDVIDYAIKKTNSTSNIKNIEPTDFHKIVQVKDFYLDITKLNSLGFKPSVSLKEGINSLLGIN